MKIKQNTHKTINNQPASTNSSVMAYDDPPITISDNQAASSTFNQNKKHQHKMLPSIASAIAEGSYHERSQLRKIKNKK